MYIYVYGEFSFFFSAISSSLNEASVKFGASRWVSLLLTEQ